MNTRIQDLAEQVLGKDGAVARKVFGHWALYDEQLEKFAELIIRECIGQVDDGNSDHAGGNSYAITRIKNHFGVR